MQHECALCGALFVLTPQKPGKINECQDCAIDVPRIQAAQGMDDTGVVDGFLKGEYPNGFASLRPGYKGGLDPSPADKAYGRA
jgi:hypothetical protein